MQQIHNEICHHQSLSNVRSIQAMGLYIGIMEKKLETSTVFSQVRSTGPQYGHLGSL